MQQRGKNMQPGFFFQTLKVSQTWHEHLQSALIINSKHPSWSALQQLECVCVPVYTRQHMYVLSVCMYNMCVCVLPGGNMRNIQELIVDIFQTGTSVVTLRKM